MASNNRYSATPVRDVKRIPAPDTIPDGTSDHIAAAIRRSRLEEQQARILKQVTDEMHIDPTRERRLRRKNDLRYTLTAKRRARISEGDTFTRSQIITRDHRTCYLCHRTNLPNNEIHIDHDLPLSRGGTHTLDNVHVACTSCNLRKGNMTSSEYRATLQMRSR